MSETDPSDAVAPQTPPEVKPSTVAARPTPLGIYDKTRDETITAIEVIAILLSALWLLGAAFFFLVLRGESDPIDSAASL